MHTSGWSWSFDFADQGGSRTGVTISYRWSLLLSLAGMGTIRAQAANEAVENVRGLLALEAGYNAGVRRSSVEPGNPGTGG